MVIDVALLDVIEETELPFVSLNNLLALGNIQTSLILRSLNRRFPEADNVVLGLAGDGGQQVVDGLEDGADGLGRDAFFA